MKQESLEEAAERIFKTHSNNTSLAEGHYDYMMDKEDFKEAFLEITKWQQERSYNEEEFLEFSQWVSHNDWVYLPSKVYWVNEEQEELDQKITTKELFEQFNNK